MMKQKYPTTYPQQARVWSFGQHPVLMPTAGWKPAVHLLTDTGRPWCGLPVPQTISEEKEVILTETGKLVIDRRTPVCGLCTRRFLKHAARTDEWVAAALQQIQKK